MARCANGSPSDGSYSTALEDLIPQAHPVRLLDGFSTRLTGTSWESSLLGTKRSASYSSQHSGQGSSVGHDSSCRSSRQLEYQLKHSIDFMWLVSGRTIDYSTICAFRREHEKA